MSNYTDPKKEHFFETNLRNSIYQFKTTWSIFSPKKIDEGAQLIIDNMEIKANDISLDMGCGYGPIGLVAARMSPKGKVHLVDKDFVAMECCKENILLNNFDNCETYLSNLYSEVPKDLQFNNIMTNLPAKAGREFVQIFVKETKQRLLNDGKLYISTLTGIRKYVERFLKEDFSEVKKIKQGKKHSLILVTN